MESISKQLVYHTLAEIFTQSYLQIKIDTTILIGVLKILT